jgi:hypothetical protein
MLLLMLEKEPGLLNIINDNLDIIDKHYFGLTCSSFHKHIKAKRGKETLYWGFLQRCRKCGAGFRHRCDLAFNPCGINDKIIKIDTEQYYYPNVIPITLSWSIKDEEKIPVYIIDEKRYFNINWGAGYTKEMTKIRIVDNKIYFFDSYDWNLITGKGAINHNLMIVPKAHVLLV